MRVVMQKKILSCVVFLTLFVLPLSAQAFTIDRNLDAGQFYVAYREASVDWRIEGTFSASSNRWDDFLSNCASLSCILSGARYVSIPMMGLIPAWVAAL